MKAIDVFVDDKVQNLLTSFTYFFKVRLSIFDVDLKRYLSTGLYPDHCAYCALLWDKLGYYDQCRNLDRTMCGHAEKSATPVTYPCHGGMMDSCLAVRFNGTLIGYAFLGQFRTQNAIPLGVLKDWQKTGMDPAILHNAFNEAPRFEKAVVDNMINLFTALCDYIVSRNFIRLRSVDIARLTAHWIDDHIAEPVMLEDVAAYLGYSQSTIYQVIKRQLGMSFKELCILKKVEHFERLVNDNPALTIEEVAAKVGYCDPFYFSRIYKKTRSATPSSYIKSVRKGVIT
jgi:AraC-like DNA-binding protein/ligand-binding sensor protein